MNLQRNVKSKVIDFLNKCTVTEEKKITPILRQMLTLIKVQHLLNSSSALSVSVFLL